MEKEDKEFKEMTPINVNELGSRCWRRGCTAADALSRKRWLDLVWTSERSVLSSDENQ